MSDAQVYRELEYTSGTTTVYQMLSNLLATCGFGLYAIGAHDDGVITTLEPHFTINALPYEDATQVAYRLLNMTALVMRPENDVSGGKLAWFRLLFFDEIRDAASYYSDGQDGTHHGFTEFEFRDHAIEPNHIFVFGNQSEDGSWDAVETGEYDRSAGELTDLLDYYLAPELTTEASLDLRAGAIYFRIKQEEELGRLVVPHDCSLELFDRVGVYDKRGRDAYVYSPAYTGKWIGLSLVGSLTHNYTQGQYDLEITLNGIQNSQGVDSGASMASAINSITEPVGKGNAAEVWRPTLSIPEPPMRKLSDYMTGFEGKLIANDLPNLTPYAQARAQDLYELGYITEKGVPTPKGLEWAQQNPTTAAARTYTGGVVGSKVYLARATQEFVKQYGHLPDYPDAAKYAVSMIPYSDVERGAYRVEQMRKEVSQLRTAAEVRADSAAGRSTSTHVVGAVQYSQSGYQNKMARLQHKLANTRSSAAKKLIQTAINKLVSGGHY